MSNLDPVRNFAKVQVSTGYLSTDTTIVLTSGYGALLPQPSTDGAFNISWWNSTDYADPADDPNVEIVRVTARSTDTLTISRAQEGTIATAKNIGAKVYKMVLAMTAVTIANINANDAANTKKANNLSDLGSASAARTNLGLGSLATQSGTFSGTSSGTNTGDQTDATLGFSDITTNNVSGTKHGFVPKATGLATQYLDGTGNWSTPAGGGGGGDMVLANVQTVTGAKTFNAGTLLDKGTMIFNVKAFGAVGNNSTDDTTAILAANTAAAVSGGVLYFPVGNYKVSGTIPVVAGVSIRGAGMFVSTITTTSVTKDVFKLATVPLVELDLEIDIADIHIVGTTTGTAPVLGASIGTVTISNANPAVATKTAHGLASGDMIYFTTTGTLPTDNTTGAPLKPNWPYFVIATGLTANAFEFSETLGGTAIHTTSAGSGTHTLTKMACGINLNGNPLDFISLRNVSVESMNGVGVYLGGPIASSLDKVISTGNLLDGIVIDGLNSAVTSVTMRNCYGNANNNVGIRLNQCTYINLSGCAADGNGISAPVNTNSIGSGYYLLDIAGGSVNGCGAEENAITSFKIDGINWGTIGLVLTGCFALDSGTTGFYITGVSTQVVMIGCVEEGASTNALVVDSSAAVRCIDPSFANAVTATGQLVVSGSKAAAGTTGTFSQPMIYEEITLTPTGAMQMNATSGFVGARLTLYVTTSGTSSFVVTFGTNFKSTGTLTTGATSAKVFVLQFVCKDGTTWAEISRTVAM